MRLIGIILIALSPSLISAQTMHNCGISSGSDLSSTAGAAIRYHVGATTIGGLQSNLFIGLEYPLIKDLERKDFISVYPNPSSGMVNINSSLTLRLVEVVDMLGEVVFSSTSEVERLQLQYLPNSLYTIRVFAQNGKIESHKITIAK